MLPDRVSNPGPLTYESGALPIALRGSARKEEREFAINLMMQLLRHSQYTTFYVLFTALSISCIGECTIDL